MIRGMDEGRPAGFWIRALALAIDFAIFFLVQVSYGALAHVMLGTRVDEAWTLTPTLWLFTLFFAGAYTIVLHTLFGQTVGKLVVGIRVLAGDAPPPFGTSLLRYCAYFASVASFGLGYVMAGLRRDKRALHDLIAGTRVEWLPEAPAPAPPPAAEPPASAPAPPPGATAV
jgi:uncharacterized RDD family membrane protein YckC